MKVRLRDQKRRKWVDVMCMLSVFVETSLNRKGCDMGFFILRDLKFQIKDKFRGDSIKNRC